MVCANQFLQKIETENSKNNYNRHGITNFNLKTWKVRNFWKKQKVTKLLTVWDGQAVASITSDSFLSRNKKYGCYCALTWTYISTHSLIKRCHPNGQPSQDGWRYDILVLYNFDKIFQSNEWGNENCDIKIFD